MIDQSLILFGNVIVEIFLNVLLNEDCLTAKLVLASPSTTLSLVVAEVSG